MWQPTASNDILKKRAAILKTIRAFFSEREILEVETPLLSHATVTDPYILSIPAIFKKFGADEKIVYLQTSPEYAMKRLLAAELGSIYQISKAFRQGEIGQFHNPEFTMMEWYRTGFDHIALMDEMDELLNLILKKGRADRLSYAALFEKYFDINPHTVTTSQLITAVEQHGVYLAKPTHDRDTLLNLLLTHCIEPNLGKDKPVFIYDFPATQAALAKIRHDENPPVASRFEVYFKGVELANGFHELQNVEEQRERFEMNIRHRAAENLPEVPLDERFLQALQNGLPDCAGVALGVDRLMMLALGCESIQEVISFAFERA